MTDVAPPHLTFTQGPAPVAVFANAQTSITFVGENGKVLAIVDTRSGHVTLKGDPNAAARVFWKAVENMQPKCLK